MPKLRVTMHNGRQGNPVHNGREGALGANIDPARTPYNAYWRWDAYFRPDSTLEDSERYYYDAWFGDWLIDQNARYRRDGHPERQKTPEQVYKSARWRPEETILQVGNLQAGSVDPKTFRAMVNEYVQVLQAWGQQNGDPYKILDYAIHFDESTPHAHIRKVWQYRDGEGNLRPGQDKALEAAGVALPDPSKPIDRKNNRKIAWDAIMRRKWQEICESYGVRIEKEPLPHKRSLPLSDIVREREADFRAREAQADQRAALAAQREADLVAREKSVAARERALEGRQRALDAREDDLTRRDAEAAQRAQESLQEREKVKALADDLETQIGALQRRVEPMLRALTLPVRLKPGEQAPRERVQSPREKAARKQIDDLFAAPLLSVARAKELLDEQDTEEGNPTKLSGYSR